MHHLITFLFLILPFTIVNVPVVAGLEPWMDATMPLNRWFRVLDGPRDFLDLLQYGVIGRHTIMAVYEAPRVAALGRAIVRGTAGCEVRDNKVGARGGRARPEMRG